LLFSAYLLFNKRSVNTGQIQPSEEQVSNPVELSAVEIKGSPYITLKPRADGHEIKMEAQNFGDFQTLEYQLSYLAKDIPRGVIGQIDLKDKNNQISRDLLLGSCSKNVCKYDDGVSEGTLMVKLKKDNQVQTQEVAFDLTRGEEAKGGLVSQDGKFIFKGTLPLSYYMVMNTLGVPKMPQGEIIAGPYGIFSAMSKNIKGTVKIKTEKDKENLIILGWDETNKGWKEYKSAPDGDFVSGEIDRLTTFVLVKPQ